MNCTPSDPCYLFGGKLNAMSSRLNSSRSPEGLVIADESTASNMRRRTVAEAFVRVQRAGGIWKTAKKFPFTKPYAYALQGLTYALILVDPLDRLEGGLID